MRVAVLSKAIRDPQPIGIQDVEATALSDALKKALRAAQIKSLAFIPLVANGVQIGMLVTYYDARHVFSEADLALAVLVARQLEFNLERKHGSNEKQLEEELAAAEHLQSISTQLISASDVEVLYEKILDAAVIIMRSDFASMQMFHPERGELQLLAHKGFNPSSVAFLAVGAAGSRLHLWRCIAQRGASGRIGYRVLRFHGRNRGPCCVSRGGHARHAIHAPSLQIRASVGYDLHTLAQPAPTI